MNNNCAAVLSAGLLLVMACDPAVERPVTGAGPSLAELLGQGSSSGFLTANGVREFEFPGDHAAHAGYRNEWWYLTGNLDGSGGRRFGYELTLFRFALAADHQNAGDSNWRSDHVFVGHLAITDVANGTFHVAERFSRGAAGLAGVDENPPQVWLYDWNLKGRAEAGKPMTWQLHARDGGMALDLALVPLKGPVLHGRDGLSQKSADPANASWYYSLPRLQTRGVLTVASKRHAVSGLSWLDREWSSSALASDQEGWDWFALQLDDGNDLMFYNLRRSDGSRDPFSAGSWIGPGGGRRALAHDDVEIDVLGHWVSPLGGRYPQGWRIRVPSRNVDLRVRPVLPNQELETWVRYWEGAVDVTGTAGATRITGRGYVELTGYADRGISPRP